MPSGNDTVCPLFRRSQQRGPRIWRRRASLLSARLHLRGSHLQPHAVERISQPYLLRFFKDAIFETTGRSSFSFRGQYTGGLGNTQSALADFLLGYITSDAYGSGNIDWNPGQLTGAAFVQDEWKLGRALKLNYGLCWEYTGSVRDDQIDRFDATDNQILTAGGPTYILDNATGLLQQSGPADANLVSGDGTRHALHAYQTFTAPRPARTAQPAPALPRERPRPLRPR